MESTIVVTVYNLAQEKGVLIGDYVAIPEPYLSKIQIKFEDKVSLFFSSKIKDKIVSMAYDSELKN